MKKAMAAASLMFFVLSNCPNASAAKPPLPPAKYADPIKQLEAEIDMAIRYESELEYCIKKLKAEQTNSEELNKLSITKQEFIDKQRSVLEKEIEKAKLGGEPIPRLEYIRDVILYTYYEGVSFMAGRFHLGGQEMITVGSLRAVINGESKFVAPICGGGKPTFSGTLSGEKYSSPRKWFSVLLPKSSNPFNVPFSIQDSSVNTPKADYDLVKFSVSDFGELLIAAVEYFPDDFIESWMKQDDHKTILSKLSLNALHSERSFPVEPEVVDESYLNTPYGEALLRIYKAEKGSLIVKVDGKNPAVSEGFDTLVAVIVAMQKNNFIYAYAENDAEGVMSSDSRFQTNSEGRNKDVLKERVQSFFANMTVHRQ